MTDDFRERGLIVDEDVAQYDGTTAVVRTEHLRRGDVEFLRWRAERWMKVRHMPAAFRHSPWFVLRHGRRCWRTRSPARRWRSVLGLEDERAVFERFREHRRREREAATVGGAAGLRRVRAGGLEVAGLDDRQLVEAHVPAKRRVDLVDGQRLELGVHLLVPRERPAELLARRNQIEQRRILRCARPTR